tara:strand:+ start:1190 stop:1396 length:207 start_codon:yes stop_codon:yes gene_type:complete
MKRRREYIELTTVWLDKRRKNHLQHLEIKETRLINQMFNGFEMECLEVRIKEHFGTREEFDEEILGWI